MHERGPTASEQRCASCAPSMAQRPHPKYYQEMSSHFRAEPTICMLAGIFVSVDLKAGVWQQRCYDPDCRDYRSPAMPIPADALKMPRHVCICSVLEPQLRQQCAASCPAHASPRHAQWCAALRRWMRKTQSCLLRLNSMRQSKLATPTKRPIVDQHDRRKCSLLVTGQRLMLSVPTGAPRCWSVCR